MANFAESLSPDPADGVVHLFGSAASTGMHGKHGFRTCPQPDAGLVPRASSRIEPPGGAVDAEAESFHRALASLWMAFHPIVEPRTRWVCGYETLLRTETPDLPDPNAVLAAAERLGEVHLLGRVVRERVVRSSQLAGQSALFFVNVHPAELLDEQLYAPDAPLSMLAKQVVLEITERTRLDQVPDVRGRVSRLRQLGYRIAVDDLGAGYSALSSIAQLEPEFVKLDISLVRDLDTVPIKQKLVRSLVSLAKEMNAVVVAEGVETAAERDALVDLGCDLLQGFLFARPGKPFPEVTW